MDESENVAPEATEEQTLAENQDFGEETAGQAPGQQADQKTEAPQSPTEIALSDGRKVKLDEVEQWAKAMQDLEETKKGYQREYTKKTTGLAEQRKQYEKYEAQIRDAMAWNRYAEANPDVAKLIEEHLPLARKMVEGETIFKKDSFWDNAPEEVREMVLDREVNRFFEKSGLEDKPEYRKAILDGKAELEEKYGVRFPADVVAKVKLFDHVMDMARVKPKPQAKPTGPVKGKPATASSKPAGRKPAFGDPGYEEYMLAKLQGS